MIEYKGYNIPEKSDLKVKGVVIPIGDTLSVMIGENVLFDTGIGVRDVYDMTDEEFKNIIFGRASGYIDSIKN